MAVHHWKSGMTGAWSTPANWFSGTVPAPGDIAVFNAGSHGADLVTGDASIGEVLVGGFLPVTFAGQLSISGRPGVTGAQSLVVDHGGTAVIQGAITAQSLIDIGETSAGTLVLAGGQVSTTGTIVIGDSASANGTVSITGTSKLTAATLVVGNHGYGTLTIYTGLGPFGSDDVSARIYVGASAGSHGVINLISGDLVGDGSGIVIGGGGTGQVIVGAQGGIYGGYDVAAHGEIRMEGGFLGGFFGTVEAGGLIDGYGQLPTSQVVNDGVIRANGDLLLNSSAQGNGPGTISGQGMLEVGSHATLDATNVRLSGQTVQFLAPTGTLDVSSHFTAGTPISGFQIGDVIRPSEALSAITFNAQSEVLSLFDNGAAVGSLGFSGSFAGTQFVLGHDAQGATITLAANSATHAIG